MTKKILTIAAVLSIAFFGACNRAKKADKMAETLTFQSAKFDTIVPLVMDNPDSP